MPMATTQTLTLPTSELKESNNPMEPKVYKNKVAQIKKLSESFIKRANSHYHKLLKRDSNPKEDTDPDLLKLHAIDLADSLLVCYLIKAEKFMNAHDIYEKLDSLPIELFPNNLVKLLYQLSAFQQESEESGYRKA
jgi:hypothetical protein